MKRRDFLRSSSIAATSPLFIDLEGFGIDLDELTGGLFGSQNSNKDVPIKDRIGHPPPSVSITVDEAGSHYTADVTVEDFHGWDAVNVYPMFSSAVDQGGAQVSLDPDTPSGSVPADRENAPEDIPDTIDIAFEARYQRNGIYFGVAEYTNGELTFRPAHEVPDYCWWDGWLGCRVDDPVANPDMATPGE